MSRRHANPSGRSKARASWTSGDSAHPAASDVVHTPDGHALPRPLDAATTLDVVQRYVEADRARSRRAMFWVTSVAGVVVLTVLALFLSVSIHVMTRSGRAVEMVDTMAAQTAMTAYEVVGVSNRIDSLAGKAREIQSVVEAREAEIARRNRVLKTDLERFSRWVAEATQTDDRKLDALQGRVVELETLLNEAVARLNDLKADTGGQEDGSVVVMPPEPLVADPGVVPLAGIAVTESMPAVAGGQADAGIPELATNVFEQAMAELNLPVPVPPRIAEGDISVVTFPSGDRYRGTFKNGLFHGWGVYTHANGDRYEGAFENDMKCGVGTMVYATGDRYSGDFKADMREGRGTLTMANGDRYLGEFRHDMPNGKGVLLYRNGNRYAGDFVNGLRHGNGVFRFVNGDVYQGEFRRDERNGRGMYTYQDGSTYVGEFRNNVRHGQGRYRYPGGEEYIGEFRDGLKHGVGVCVYPNGSRVRVEWKQDELVRVIEGAG
ncbi:MAG: hypothetical protein A2498_14205 [Lentisphaerae bacterium RIFOXYC12_FULL_60_16]|nr:MAG: hypothetical protein A2498_14205 [Lentisphaerae bacterium RIFOXYC12_FULL_60_16]OGV72964.1 MAG: hypothetical protein A2269_03335 [Lentisphaerae bacterium RIFOXYA12_FULL_60_10]OGV85156.1 MAG: hypothetical protein A2340_01150 [Lentisphaerae bacterium RIFOXYB12_FULL_60_10]